MSDDIVVNMNFNLGKDQTVTDIIDRLLPFIHDEMRMPAGMIKDVIEEIERLRLESLQLQGLVRAHEGMYGRAAEQIDQQRNWLERLYRLTVGHGPNWGVFDSWEDAITAYEEARHD